MTTRKWLPPLVCVLAVVALTGTASLITSPEDAAAHPVAPNAPTGVTVVPGDTTALVSWNAVTPPKGSIIKSYTVKVLKGGGCTTKGGLSCTVTGLQSGISYTVEVRDVAGSKKSAYSTPVTVTPGLPTAPTDVSALAGAGQVIVSFAAPADNGSTITGYDVTAIDSTNSTHGGEIGTGGSSPITVLGLTNGDNCSFTVTARNRFGSGAPSTPSRVVVPSAQPLLEATGSSFAALAIQEWVGQADPLFGIDINFQPLSSVYGLNSFAQGDTDFVATEIPYSSDQANAIPSQPYQYLPDVAGGLAFMYNLQGVNGQQIKNLILNAQTIDAIFTGKISDWDDPSIAAINPQLTVELPHTTIIPVYREDASGSNYLLSNYLLHEDGPTFEAYQTAVRYPEIGQPTAAWPVSQTFPPAGYPNYTSLIGENGSGGVANYVSASSSAGSIGYVETGYAVKDAFPVASLVNASGAAVQPTSPDVATALEAATFNPDLTQNLTGVYASTQPGAYPLSSYSYLIAPCSPSLALAQGAACDGPGGTSPFSSARGLVFGQFVAYLVCAGQENVSQLGYSPLPLNLVQADFDAIGRVNGAVEPPAPSATNCPNPNVAGSHSGRG